MGAKTGIEWTDATWNPIRGCSRVSEGCRHCYAETMASRFSGDGQAYNGLAVMQDGKPHWTGKIEFVEKHLLDPLKWGPVITGCLTGQELPHAKRGHCPNCEERPRRIFVNSMSDLFHENVPDAMRDKIFAVMALCPQHTFQVLTKRPARMLEYLTSGPWGRIEEEGVQLAPRHIETPAGDWVNVDTLPLPNVWLGVSVEDQKSADERIPLLLQTPAAVRFISAEPLLGPVDLTNVMKHGKTRSMKMNCVEAKEANPAHPYLVETLGADYPYTRLDWVICGGESGPGARPMHPEWARLLRDQCAAAAVPFFFKQWGEYLPAMTDGAKDRSGALVINASDDPLKVGKHAAGALLDGREWKQFPGVAR